MALKNGILQMFKLNSAMQTFTFFIAGSTPSCKDDCHGCQYARTRGRVSSYSNYLLSSHGLLRFVNFDKKKLGTYVHSQVGNICPFDAVLYDFTTLKQDLFLQAGDGTNFVLIFAGALLQEAEKLLRMVRKPLFHGLLLFLLK